MRALRAILGALLCMVLLVIILCLGVSAAAAIDRGAEANEMGWSLLAILACSWLFFKVWDND